MRCGGEGREGEGSLVFGFDTVQCGVEFGFAVGGSAETG